MLLIMSGEEIMRKQAFRLKAAVLFSFSQISSVLDDTVCTGAEEGRVAWSRGWGWWGQLQESPYN